MVEFSKSNIFNHYVEKFKQFGDTAEGMDWPSQESAEKRYEAFWSCRPTADFKSIFDYGCGTGRFFDFLNLQHSQDFSHIQKFIFDLNGELFPIVKMKHPEAVVADLKPLDNDGEVFQRYDYVVANGVFTEKLDYEYESFLEYFAAEVDYLFSFVEQRLSLNVMSNHVDYCYKDLFHLDFDLAYSILKRKNRKISFVADYGLYEYIIVIDRV